MRPSKTTIDVCIGLALSAVLAGCSDSPAPESVAGPVNDATLNALVKSASSGKAVMLDRFEGPNGLIGVLMGAEADADVARVVGWVTQDGKHLMIGRLTDSYGRDLTVLAASHYKAIAPTLASGRSHHIPSAAQGERVVRPAPQAAPAPVNVEQAEVMRQAFYEDVVNNVVGLSVGSGPKQLYVFFDPYCGHCHQFYRNIERASVQASHTVHWIPVGFQRPVSREHAASMLAEGPSALANMKLLAPRYNAEATPELQAAVDANKALLAKTGRVSTPTLVYRTETGVEVNIGAPRGARLSELLDLIKG
ncbi:MAG: hypothetical protein PVI92_16035 [Chromatiales bacterium]|jgi:thiol:disulfide interchange protein DsbG